MSAAFETAREFADDDDDGAFRDVCAGCGTVRTVHIWNGRALCDDCADRLLFHGPEDDYPAEAANAWNAFPLLTYADLLDLPDPAWLIDGLVPEGLAVLYGAPGTFKSFAALDWALSVATGQPWHGRDVRGGYVVYIAAEGHGGLCKRVEAWRETHGRPDMTRVRFLAQAVNLLDAEQVERTRCTLATLPEPPALLVIDTAARSMVGGDENSARDVGMFIAAIDGQNAGTRLVVHHAGKAGDERGSSALRGAADMMARVERDGQAPCIDLVCDKPPKDGASWPTITLRSEPVAESLVLALVPPLTAAFDAETERRKRVLAFVVEHGPVSRNRIETSVGGKASAVRSTLDALVVERLIGESRQGQAKLYSEPRPTLGDEVGTRSLQVTADRTSSRRGEDPVGVPGGDEVGQTPSATSSLVPETRSTCSGCGSLMTNVNGRSVCFACKSRGAS